MLTFCFADKLRAEDTTPTIVGNGTCGASCTYTLDSAGTLTLYGEGDMTEYKYTMYGDDLKWNDGNDLSPGHKYGNNIKSIVFAEGSNITSIGPGTFIRTGVSDGITIPDSVTKIGAYSFQLSGLTELIIPESVTSIGASAFWDAKKLTSINIPESVTNMGNRVFRDTPKLSEIIIPDTIDTSRWDAQVFYGLSPDTEIVCQGDVERCKQKLAKYIPESKGGNCTSNCIKKDIQPALFDSCKSTNYFWDGSTCIREPDVTKRKCCTSCKDMGGWCNRIRYTPAEAAELLRDDNTNEVTITFKK